MAPRCKKIKYKEKRRSGPVVKIEKQIPPPPNLASSVKSETSQFLYDLGEIEYEEIEEKKPEKTAIERLKEWAQNQRFIPQDLSKDFLTLFLSSAGNNVGLAAEKIQKYFYARQEPSYLFRNRDPFDSENLKIFKKLYVIPLPGTTDDGKKVILTGLVEPTSRYYQLDHAKALAMVLDLLIWEKNFSSGEFVIVLDGRGFECPQLLEYQAHDHKTIKSLLLDTIPGTLRSFYFLYPPPHVAKVADSRDGIWITVVKTKQRMIKHLPARILPFEYGGTLGRLGDLLGKWEIHMFQCRKFFVNFEKRMINDHRRRLCHENEIRNGGKNWVQNMKLEEDEWEYKVQYYERMRNMSPLQHPAFGSKRNLLKPKEKPRGGNLDKFRQKAKEEAEKEKIFEPSPFYNGYAKEIKKAQLKAELEKWRGCCASSPVLELEIFCE